mgnify:FL=1
MGVEGWRVVCGGCGCGCGCVCRRRPFPPRNSTSIHDPPTFPWVVPRTVATGAPKVGVVCCCGCWTLPPTPTPTPSLSRMQWARSTLAPCPTRKISPRQDEEERRRGRREDGDDDGGAEEEEEEEV